MKKLNSYQYNDDIKQQIMSFKDIISIKEFYWNAKNACDMYLLSYTPFDYVMRASSNWDEYVDVFTFKIDYTGFDKRVEWHGYLITQGRLELVSYERLTAKNR